MRRRALLVALALALPAAARALGGAASVGTTSADFLQLGVGARALAMGEAYTAMADDASALYWNPAGLARIPEHYASVTAMDAPYVATSYYDYLAFAQNLGSYGSLGASYQYFTLGSVAQTSMDGTSLGNSTPYDMALSAGYAHPYGGFLFGVSGKYVSSRLAATAQTEAFDFGIMFPSYFHDRLRLAFVAQNIGGRLHYDQVNEDLPLTYKLGSSWRFNSHWTAALDLAMPSDNQPYAAIGVERTWRISPALAFAGRAGFNSRTVAGLDGLTAFSLGMGFSGRNASIDYAFVPLGTLGMTHRFSLSWKFDARRTKKPKPVIPPAPKKEKETSSVQASVQYSTQTSLPPPSHLHCEEYHGVTVCMDADQRQRLDISYDPGDPQETAPEPKAPGDDATPPPAAPEEKAKAAAPTAPAAPGKDSPNNSTP